MEETSASSKAMLLRLRAPPLARHAARESSSRTAANGGVPAFTSWRAPQAIPRATSLERTRGPSRPR